MNGKKLLISIGLILIIFLMYNFGLFHSLQKWDEKQFIDQDINLLIEYLHKKDCFLIDETNSISRKGQFKKLSGKSISKNQKLYRFWGNKKHKFWYFPIGTKTYGLYVVVENGIIIDFVEFSEIDSL